MTRALSGAEVCRHERQLNEEGYTIVERLLGEDETDAVALCLRDLHDRQNFGTNDFAGYRIRRVLNLFAKTRGLDGLLVDPTVLGLVRSKIGLEAQLLIASTMEIYPGETLQTLHRDDAYSPSTRIYRWWSTQCGR